MSSRQDASNAASSTYPALATSTSLQYQVAPPPVSGTPAASFSSHQHQVFPEQGLKHVAGAPKHDGRFPPSLKGFPLNFTSGVRGDGHVTDLTHCVQEHPGNPPSSSASYPRGQYPFGAVGPSDIHSYGPGGMQTRDTKGRALHSPSSLNGSSTYAVGPRTPDPRTPGPRTPGPRTPVLRTPGSRTASVDQTSKSPMTFGHTTQVPFPEGPMVSDSVPQETNTPGSRSQSVQSHSPRSPRIAVDVSTDDPSRLELDPDLMADSPPPESPRPLQDIRDEMH